MVTEPRIRVIVADDHAPTRAGVLASPNRTTWTRNDQRIVAGPDAAAGGPYLRIVVGLGGR